jgi:hypothetical protein
MGVLAEYLKTEAENLKAQRQKQKDAVEEWQQCLSRLIAMLGGWISAADAGLGLLSTRVEPHSAEEPRLGHYLACKLSILFGDVPSGSAWTVAEVVPRARHVVSVIHPTGRKPRWADGMVVIREGRLATHYLLRWREEGGDEWFICSDAEWDETRPSEEGRVKPLTADLFELAVLRAVK